MKLINDFCCRQNKNELLKYLLVKTAPVMIKVKPALLLRISSCNQVSELKHYDVFCVHQQEILETLQLDYKIMKNNGNDIQILFYDREQLNVVLSKAEVKAFLSEHGYYGLKTPEQYLMKLSSRFTNADFPHEIGIFLGYPLKDVKGFVSRSQSHVPVPNGMWKVFGDPAESLHLMWKFRFAEDIGRYVTSQYQDAGQCISKLKNAILTERQLIF